MRLLKNTFILSLTVGCLWLGTGRAHAFQDPQADNPPAVNQDPISQLHLTPEQRQKIRAIREENKEERALVNQRLRESNLALEQALDVENPSEADIELRLRDVATAQAASTRIRVLTELKIRRVLTAEQITMWKALRQQAAAERRNQLNQARPAQRNGMAPLFQRQNQQPLKNPRP